MIFFSLLLVLLNYFLYNIKESGLLSVFFNCCFVFKFHIKFVKFLRKTSIDQTQLLKLKYSRRNQYSEYLKQKNKSELQDKMVEITSEEQNNVKRMKRNDSLRDH